MATLTSHTVTDRPERLRAIGPVLSASAVLLGLVVGAALLLAKSVDLLAWFVAAD